MVVVLWADAGYLPGSAVLLRVMGGLQASHTPTPSLMCDQRAANSRRLGVAGTAAATRLKLCITVLFGLCGCCIPVTMQQ